MKTAIAAGLLAALLLAAPSYAKDDNVLAVSVEYRGIEVLRMGLGSCLRGPLELVIEGSEPLKLKAGETLPERCDATGPAPEVTLFYWGPTNFGEVRPLRR